LFYGDAPFTVLARRSDGVVAFDTPSGGYTFHKIEQRIAGISSVLV
jgi:hypothetical protein